VAWPGLKETLVKLRNLRAETLVITDESNREAIEYGKRVICLPVALPELYTPIPYIVPAQLFAARLAEHKGLNPDEPRTLSKVTKTL
jgi:glucosamine--fructose-6-phosphate aminotransferase (isomerizing)